MNMREWLITNNPTNLITVLMDKLFRQIVCAKTKLHGQNVELLGKCPMSDRYFHPARYGRDGCGVEGRVQCGREGMVRKGRMWLV